MSILPNLKINLVTKKKKKNENKTKKKKRQKKTLPCSSNVWKGRKEVYQKNFRGIWRYVSFTISLIPSVSISPEKSVLSPIGSFLKTEVKLKRVEVLSKVKSVFKFTSSKATFESTH